MLINLGRVTGPRERIKFSGSSYDGTAEYQTETVVTVPTRNDVALMPGRFAGKPVLQVGEDGFLARRNEGGAGWSLVERVHSPIDGSTVEREYGVFKPGMLSRWNTNFEAIADKKVTPLATRTIEGFIHGDDEGSWYRAFDVRTQPTGIRIDGDRTPAVLSHDLTYLSTWTESN